MRGPTGGSGLDGGIECEIARERGLGSGYVVEVSRSDELEGAGRDRGRNQRAKIMHTASSTSCHLLRISSASNTASTGFAKSNVF